MGSQVVPLAMFCRSMRFLRVALILQGGTRNDADWQPLFECQQSTGNPRPLMRTILF